MKTFDLLRIYIISNRFSYQITVNALMYMTAIFLFLSPGDRRKQYFQGVPTYVEYNFYLLFIFDIYLEEKLGSKKNHIYELSSPKVSIVFIHNL